MSDVWCDRQTYGCTGSPHTLMCVLAFANDCLVDSKTAAAAMALDDPWLRAHLESGESR